MKRELALAFVLVVFTKYVQSQNEDEDDDPNEIKYDRQSANLTKALFKNYNYLVRPCGENSEGDVCTPVDVAANMKILGITSIDDEKMNFNMQFLLRQDWKDDRLKHNGKSDLILDTSEPQSRVWTPDTFFMQEKDTYKALSGHPNSQYRISPSGIVSFSTRLSTTLACPMDLRKYPFDTQKCNLQFGSYAQTKEHVHFKWNENRAVELAAEVRHTTPTFELGEVTKKDCKHHWVTGAYSCLKAEIEFKRQFGFGALMANFVPSFVLVVLSWLSFYLGSDNIGIRALLVAGCLQFLLIHWSILSINLPHVAGCRAIDVWFISCVIFLILSLLQLLLVIKCPAKSRRPLHAGDVEMVLLDRYPLIDEQPAQQPQPKQSRSVSRGEAEQIRKQSVIKMQRKYTRVATSSPNTPTINEASVSPMVPTSQYFAEPSSPPKKGSKMNQFSRLSGRDKVDVVSRFIFPALFVMFNFIYWLAY